MLVRRVGGDWSAVEAATALGAADFAELCASDVGALLELGAPRHVLALRPTLDGFAGPDAVCLAPDGSVSLVVGAFEEPLERTVTRLVNTVGSLRTWTAEAFLDRFGATVASDDPAELHEQVGASLREARFELLLVVPDEPAPLRPTLDVLGAAGCIARCFRLELLGGATMEAVVPVELSLDRPARQQADAPHHAFQPPPAAQVVPLHPAPVSEEEPATPELHAAPAAEQHDEAERMTEPPALHEVPAPVEQHASDELDHVDEGAAAPPLPEPASEPLADASFAAPAPYLPRGVDMDDWRDYTPAAPSEDDDSSPAAIQAKVWRRRGRVS